MYYLVGRDVESRCRDPATKNLLLIIKKKPLQCIKPDWFIHKRGQY